MLLNLSLPFLFLSDTNRRCADLPRMSRGSRVVSALASCARGPGFDPRQRRGKFVGPNTLPFVSFAGMT